MVKDEEMRFALDVLNDHRRLIAAGKTHRWDIVKWAVTINVTLAGASVTLVKLQQTESHMTLSPQLMFLWIAAVVFVLAVWLMWEVTRRMTAARNDARTTLIYLAGKQIDIRAVTGREVPPKPYDKSYDRQESRIYIAIVLASVVPAFAVWLLFVERWGF